MPFQKDKRARLPNPWVILLLFARACALAVSGVEIALVLEGKRRLDDANGFHWVNLGIASASILVESVEMVPLLDPFKKIPRANPCGLMSFDLALFMAMIPVLVVYTTKRSSGEWRVPAPELEAQNGKTYVLLVCMFAVRTCLMLWGCIRVCFWPANRKPVGVGARAASGMSVEMGSRVKQHSAYVDTV